MNVEEIEEHGLVLAIQAAQMHSINCKEASAAATAIVKIGRASCRERVLMSV